MKLQSKFAALFNAKSAAAQQKRLCTTPNLPAQDLAPVFNANFDRRTKNKNAPSYKLLLIIMAGIPMAFEQLVYYTNILNLTLREDDESQECHEKSFLKCF